MCVLATQRERLTFEAIATGCMCVVWCYVILCLQVSSVALSDKQGSRPGGRGGRVVLAGMQRAAPEARGGSRWMCLEGRR